MLILATITFFWPKDEEVIMTAVDGLKAMLLAVAMFAVNWGLFSIFYDSHTRFLDIIFLNTTHDTLQRLSLLGWFILFYAGLEFIRLVCKKISD